MPLINRLVVVGVGLIGGSLAAALRASGACREIIGIALDSSTCERAVELGVVDRAYTSLDCVSAELCEGDVVFVSVPTLSVPEVLRQVRDCVSSEVTVTDAASVKGSVLAAAELVWGAAPSNFVLGHPIAGSEKSGVTAANPALYRNHRVIVTPLPVTDDAHLQRVVAMWQAAGAEVLSMSVAEHDDVLAATSHLPHAIAYSLVDTLAHDSENENIFRYAAGGFRDFTRIASSDPRMWHDIMLANKESVLKSLDLFSDNLARLREAVEAGDSGVLLGVFSRAKEARDEFTSVMAASGKQKNSHKD